MFAATDEDLTQEIRSAVRAPYRRSRVFFAPLAEAIFERLRGFVASHSGMAVGYSVKTNPRPELLHLARVCGFYAECISAGEAASAAACGFAPAQTIYNGPKPAASLSFAPKYVFADSVESFVEDHRALAKSIVGVRLRPHGVRSRFGVPPDEWQNVASALRASGATQTAVSFQVRSEDYPPGGFRAVIDDVTSAAAALERASGVSVVAFDVGGGRSPYELDESIASGDFDFLAARIAARLPSVRETILEPGQEITAPLEAVVAPVLEVRRRAAGTDVIVDAGVPDVPTTTKMKHRVFLLHVEGVSTLADGSDRILGRTCLEDDVLANVALPPNAAVGDAIVLADAGAYDSSMRYAFAQGLQSGNTAP